MQKRGKFHCWVHWSVFCQSTTPFWWRCIWTQFVKLAILTTKVWFGYQQMLVDYLFKRLWNLWLFSQNPPMFMYAISQGHWPFYIFYVNALHCMENAFISNAFSCFKKKVWTLTWAHPPRVVCKHAWLCRMLGFWGPFAHFSQLPPQCNLHWSYHLCEELCNKRVIWYNHVRGEGWGCRYALFVFFLILDLHSLMLFDL